MVSGWVLDCSLALAWALPDEGSRRADRFWKNFDKHHSVWVPALWWSEISNALVVARRRERLTEADWAELMTLFSQLPIMTDAQVASNALLRFGSVAWEHDLSAYDAAYLELARRRGFGLATLDAKLTRAAKNAGVPVWEKG